MRVSALDTTTLFAGFWGSLLGSLHFLFPTTGLFSIQQVGSIKTFSFIPSLVLCRNWPMLLFLWELSAAYQRRPSLYITHLELVPPLRNRMKCTHVWAYLFKNTHQKTGDHNLSSINALGSYALWGQSQVSMTCQNQMLQLVASELWSSRGHLAVEPAPASPELSCPHCILLTHLIARTWVSWVGRSSLTREEKHPH